MSSRGLESPSDMKMQAFSPVSHTPLALTIRIFQVLFLVLPPSFLCVCVWPSPVLFATPWTVAGQAPLFMGFSRQECWSGSPFLLQYTLIYSRFKYCTYILLHLHTIHLKGHFFFFTFYFNFPGVCSRMPFPVMFYPALL